MLYLLLIIAGVVAIVYLSIWIIKKAYQDPEN